MSLSQAREKFREERKILSAGKDPGEMAREKKKERREAWTVDDLCDSYLKEYAMKEKRPRSAREDELNLARDIRPAWGKRKAMDITRKDVKALLKEIVNRGAKVQANRTLATVRGMYAWALSEEEEESCIKFNPAAGITKPTTEVPKERALSLDEIVTVWKNLDGREDVPMGVKKTLKLVLLTGLRPGEVVAGRGDQLAGDWLELSGTSTKNKRPHRAYLSTLARQVAGDTDAGLIVAKDDGSPIPVYTLSFWLRRCNHFGVAPWTAHDLRRTCATRLAELGTAPHVVDRVLNHVQTGVTGKVYDKYTYGPEISRALEKWGQKIEQAVTGKKADNLVPFPMGA
jgi:integrase